MWTIATAVLASLLGLVARQPPHVRIDLAFEGVPVTPRLAAHTVEEVAAIWSPYDVDVQNVCPDSAGREEAIRIAVIMAARPDRRIAADALGSILFRDDLPRPSIVMYPDAVVALVARTPMPGRAEREWPPSLRDQVVGRVLGRALAHEIGHFLLHSPHHSAAGLMRARHSAYDLVSTDRQAFTLSADEIARLTSVLSMAF